MVEPKQKPHRSKQDYQTPADFLASVKLFLGIDAFAFDFAADADNKKAPGYFDADIDALSVTGWDNYIGNGWGWLNPPFTRIGPWAERCQETGQRANIALLVPAAVGSNWFRTYVEDRALVLCLNGRLAFTDEPYPKDCILCLFGPRISPDIITWRWRECIQSGIVPFYLT